MIKISQVNFDGIDGRGQITMSRKILIERSKHNEIYIFEGNMRTFSLKEDLFCLHMSSGVEYFDTIVEDENIPGYYDESKIFFLGITYLKLDFFGPMESIIEIGNIKENDVVLDYGGGWGDFSTYQIPTGFSLDIVCKDIELEFFDTKPLVINNNLSIVSRLFSYLKGA